MNDSSLTRENVVFDKGYNCFCSPIGVFLKLGAFPYIDSILYQSWDFFYSYESTACFEKFIGTLYQRTQVRIKENLIQLHGIELKKRVESDSYKAFEFLKQKLDQSQPVMITLDLHYLPYLPYSEKKYHNLHFLLMTGYNEESNQASVIDSFAGYQGTLPLAILSKARQSRINGHAIQNCWYEFEFTNNTSKTLDDRLQDLLLTCKKKLKLWNTCSDPGNGHEAIRSFAVDIQNLCRNSSLLSFEKAAEYVRDIEWQRTGFLAFLKEIAPYLVAVNVEMLILELQKISKMWSQVRRSLYLYKFSKESKHLSGVDLKILDLAEKERDLIFKIENSICF